MCVIIENAERRRSRFAGQAERVCVRLRMRIGRFRQGYCAAGFGDRSKWYFDYKVS